nr:MAG TPA: Protein of unknown function (DUF1372) [Caudoviricetes sp.]
MENLKDVLRDVKFSFLGALLIGLISFGGGVYAQKTQLTKAPIIIYKVDNAGAEIDGKIVDKEIIEGRYTVTVASYGKFLVTKSQYESLKVGDDMPEYLKK